jgi:RimJ/RimL family protein N-acetyltransferase
MESMAISIRLARKGDAAGFVDAWNESFRKGHLRYTATRQRDRQSVKRFQERFSKNRRHAFSFVAVTRTGAIVGNCGLDARESGRTRHRGEVGWVVHHDYVGRGIATRLVRAVLKEAKRRGFKRVEAEVATANRASVRLAQKFGFRLEGRRKAGILLDSGRYLDTYLFGKTLR